MAIKNKTTGIGLIALFASALIAFQASAQDQSLSEWQWDLNISSVSIDSDAALQQGVDDSAFSLGVAANYVSANWVTSFTLDLFLYDDNNEFRQDVIGEGLFNSGDRTVESSEATAALFSVATGYRWKFGEKDAAAFDLQGGYSVVGFSERSISNCSDCYSEDIDLDGGAFIQASIRRNISSYSIGLFTKQYVSGDLGGTIGIFVGSEF